MASHDSSVLPGGLGYLIDHRHVLHDPGPHHPESPARLSAIDQALREFEDAANWQRLSPRKATLEELQLIHTPLHIRQVELACRRAPSYLDYDTAVSAGSYDAALLAAGGVLECVDAVCTGRLSRVFAFVRPPGHHAYSGSARGFCLFNNVAIAAAFARSRYGLSRIAIADIDVHHGDGTQSCFYDTPAVLYISSHQFPFYPGTGNFDETGHGEGEGYTLNFPLPAGTADSTFVPIYSRIVSSVLSRFCPELILVSTGFDAHFDDPLGGLVLTEAGYASVAASLILAAEQSCGGKICFILEGGYSRQGLRECTLAIMKQMEKRRPEELNIKEATLFLEIADKAAKPGFWKW